MNYSISHSARFHNLRALLWDGTKLYSSRGYSVLCYDTANPNNTWDLVGRYSPNLIQRISEKSIAVSRIRRAGFHSLILLEDNSLLGIIDKALVKLDSNTNTFKTVFNITRGTRPLSVSKNPQGHLYWGEYFNNPNRESVHIYSSYDSGENWSIAYTFPKSQIRHIHNIIWDKYLEQFWIFTGDDHDECLIMKADPNMQTLDIVFAGTQQIRCVAAIPRPEGLYFATDTPFEINNICLIDHANNLHTISELSSSSLSACHVGNLLFFSSAVEPSNVNKTKHTSLEFSEDGRNWNNVVKWEKSRLPSKLFQFANISLPSGNNSSSFLAATGIAVNKEHMVTHLWEIQKYQK